ncbi:MAG TPA: fumarate hydratase [Candidatus Brocadiia bacterium]|nr:fumarate hydratase [Candidatus Brocadiales bacterium]
MHQIKAQEIIEKVSALCMDASFNLSEDVIRALEQALEREESPIGKEIITQLLENARIGREESMPICQDTGVACIFVEVGQDVQIAEGSLYEAINEGIRRGYREGYLRKSMVKDPFDRVNTGDNTPAVIHTDIVPGDKLKITILEKGGGCENMSRLTMLTPAQGQKGVIDFVVNTVREAGANPCPPIIVGVGIGGTFDYAAYLAKKSLLRPIGMPNPDPATAALERELLEKINSLGIGPQGIGGTVTALAVHVEKHPCHITSLPVAVNIECHSHRHKTVVL